MNLLCDHKAPPEMTDDELLTADAAYLALFHLPLPPRHAEITAEIERRYRANGVFFTVPDDQGFKQAYIDTPKYETRQVVAAVQPSALAAAAMFGRQVETAFQARELTLIRRSRIRWLRPQGSA